MDEESFEKAIKDPSYRVDFLKTIDAENMSKYVDQIIYDPIYNPLILMLFRAKKGILKKKTQIVISPLSFSRLYHRTYNDFLSTLIDHEGYHAKEFHIKTKNKINDQNIFGCLEDKIFSLRSRKDRLNIQRAIIALENYSEEVGAYESQLLNSNKRQISSNYRLDIKQKLEIYKHAVSNIKTFLKNQPVFDIFRIVQFIQ